jgi:pyruvate dehydrogenase E1 component beta subunit
MRFSAAADAGLAQAMAEDDRVLTWGEDVRLLHRELLLRFGPDRVLDAPISEAAFTQAGVGAAFAGLRPVVEVMMADFLATAWSALLNSASKLAAFSGGRLRLPLVIRSASGGWYGDGGQHGQSVWGSLAGIPGLKVAVASTPADAAGLMLAAVRDDDPVVLLEPKLLSDTWLDYLGGASRRTVSFDVPGAGAEGDVELPVQPTPLGAAAVRRAGADVALISIGVGVHRALAAAEMLAADGIDALVLDLRTVAPLDIAAITGAATRTGRVVVIDEDYVRAGLTGEIAAVLAESGTPARYARVAVEDTIPFARHLEAEALPNANRIARAAKSLA